MHMKKILLSLVPVIVLVGLIYGGYTYKQYSDFYASIVPLVNASTTKPFTMADVVTHNGTTTCYTLINDGVYDLTTWVERHPGGAKRILDICGKDGTAKFEKKHGKDDKVLGVLANFQIGSLIK